MLAHKLPMQTSSFKKTPVILGWLELKNLAEDAGASTLLILLDLESNSKGWRKKLKKQAHPKGYERILLCIKCSMSSGPQIPMKKSGG